jgi:putative ABC transport system ATP-binding protein
MSPEAAPRVAAAHPAVTHPVIETRGLGKVYSPNSEAEVIALEDVNLRIGPGDTPSSGTYLCDGVDVAELDAEARAALRRDKIGFVFQGFNLLSRMSALDNVAMPLSYARVPVAERRQRATEALMAVGLGERMHHRPSELSGGQQQRVAIARALIHRPAILMADEPTGALDSRTGQEILALFERLRGEGHTIILITHDAEVAAHADRVCVMRDGRLDTDAPSERGTRSAVERTAEVQV